MSLADELLTWDDARRPIEWRGKTVYVSALTVSDLQHVLKKHPDVLSGKDLGGMVEVIIRKVEDEKGEPVFTLEHKPKLMRQPMNEITDLFNSVFSEMETYEEAEKK